MTLKEAVETLNIRFGTSNGVDAEKIAGVLKMCGAPNHVSQGTLDKVVRAGEMLAKLGVK